MATSSEGSRIGKDSSRRKSARVLILGDVGIGKTTLIKLYLRATGVPVEDLYIEEVGFFSMYPLRMNCKGSLVDVGLMDLHPGSIALNRRRSYPANINVILLCFSIGNRSTLQSVCNLWIHEVRSHFGKQIPVLLVGLKSDMRVANPGTIDSVLGCEEHGVVAKCDAEKIHKDYNFYGDYMECSMYDKDSVIHVIRKTVHVAMED